MPGRTKPNAPAPTAGRDAPRAEERAGQCGRELGRRRREHRRRGRQRFSGVDRVAVHRGLGHGTPPPTGTVAILAGTVENARDLGGVALQDGTCVRYGALYRGPPLSDLSASGCARSRRSAFAP